MEWWNDPRECGELAPEQGNFIKPFNRQVEVTPEIMTWLEADPTSSKWNFGRIIRRNKVKTINVFSPGGPRFMIGLPDGTNPGDDADVLDRLVGEANTKLKVFDAPLPECFREQP